MGSSWFIGDSAVNAVKIDIYYTDPYIRPVILSEGIRLAAKEDIIAMKLEVLGNTARKKDFWDLHRLHEEFSLKSMIEFHKERFPFSHSSEELRLAFTNFSSANDDLDPICLLEKQWPLIKLDFVEWCKEI
jgi:Nucleotidyl transferase AbiEii toxin, Type IV TA system